MEWLKANFLPLDVFLLPYLLFLLVLTATGAANGGRFTADLLLLLVPMLVGYLVLQRLALRYDRAISSGGGVKPPRWLTVMAFAAFLAPIAMVPATFLSLGKLMIDNGLVPSIETHPDFVQGREYDPDHRWRIMGSRSADDPRSHYLPYETDEQLESANDRSLNLGPYGAATSWDLTLKNIDIAMFGVYPSEWVRQFHTPWLTGVMQLGYVFYYIAPPLACVPLLFARRRRRQPGEPPDPAPTTPSIDLSEFRIATAVIGACILLTYVIYFLVPATGPRFEGGIEWWLPDQPGWFGAETMYRAIDAAETFRWNAFPSGHVAVSIVCMLVALRFRRRIGLAMILPVIALCLATVYMGYHYVIDVIGGIACAAIAMAFVPGFAAWWNRRETLAK